MDTESWRKGTVQCASGARALLTGVLVAAQKAEAATENDGSRRRLQAFTDRLAAAAGALFAVQEKRVSDPAAMRAKIVDAHRALEKAIELIAELSAEHPQLASQHKEVLARALALVFAAGGGPAGSVPAARRSSTSMKAVRVSTGTSSPTIELGEIEAGLAELGLDDRGEPVASSRSGGASRSSPRIQAVEVDVAQLGLAPGELDGLVAAHEASSDGSAGTKSDRRGTDRVMLEVDVGFVTESNFYAGLSMDVSAGGVFVATYQARPAGTPVVLSFLLPDGHAVTTPGVVRWVRESAGDGSPGMGVAFADLATRDLEAIQAFCKRRQPLYYDAD